MLLRDLFEEIGLLPQAREIALALNENYDHNALAPLWEKLYSAATREEGLAALREHFGEDKDGMKMFVCQSNCALHTHDLYVGRKIPERIFADTMKFLSRFIRTEFENTGKITYRWDWWFPRQLDLSEFRIGQLEYEMLEEDGEKKISLHIPSDTDLSAGAVQASLEEARTFFAKYFPAYAQCDMYCDSWLLSPALPNLLPPSSNIIQFRNRFEILRTNEDSMAVLDWICPDPSVPLEQLPEKTLLQRAVKAHLLAGGKIGRTAGRLKRD